MSLTNPTPTGGLNASPHDKALATMAQFLDAVLPLDRDSHVPSAAEVGIGPQFPSMTCPECEGEGEVVVRESRCFGGSDYDEFDSVRCSECRGSGRVPRRTLRVVPDPAPMPEWLTVDLFARGDRSAA